MIRPELAALTLEAPAALCYGGRSADVGASVWRALALLRERAGSAGKCEVCERVWGVREVAKRTLASLCHRANEKLEAVGAPLRCGVDGDFIRLF